MPITTNRARSRLTGLAVAAMMAIPAMFSSSETTVAQEPPIIGVLVPLSQEDWGTHADAFVQGMAELGYVDGENVRIEIRFANRNPELYGPLSQELVALGAAVLVSGSTVAAINALSAATTTIPIVIAIANEADFRNWVANLERPEGNITGLINADIDGEDEILFAKELMPDAQRIGYLVRADQGAETLQANEQNVLDAAAALGVTVVFGEAELVEEALPAYHAVLAQGVDIMVVSGGGMYISALPELAAAAREAGMPTTYRQVNAVAAGGLISHGRDQVVHWHDAAALVDQLLKGATVADIPITRGVPLAIRVNMTLADELGLIIPPSILDRAVELVR